MGNKMGKKIWKYLLILVIAIIAIIMTVNIYKWIRCGNQTVTINTPQKAYSNSDLYVTIGAFKNGEELKATSKVKFLDANKREVSNTKVMCNEENCIISIPDVETGNYIIEAYVSTKAGEDTVQKGIYISNGTTSNYTITLDKGIYKPGDTVNYRTLITSKTDNKPVKSDVNVCIYDGNNNKVYNEKMSTSNYGIISGSFELANEVNSGIYKLVVINGQEEEIKNFKVNPYIMPKYEVKIETDKKNYLINETADVNIKANYFFGEPASGAKFVVFVNDREYKTLMADSNGIANFKYEIKSPSTYNIRVEAVDASNYYVEQTSSFVAGTDIFEVSLMPEYGKLITMQKNNVYVFTKKSDGSPVKAYVTIASGTYNKQVITDENGIGKFTIDVDNSQKPSFNVTATNMEGESVKKEVILEYQSANLLVSTDKVKYAQGEDIRLNVASEKQNNKNIYFFKNDKLIKSVNTNLEETTVNLGDTYGLIDVFVSDINGKHLSNSTYKRTIFIKPKNSLSIGVKTDKEEYKPGEEIKISFETTEENNNKIDAALLVSMLDNSILSLADNDLSIDNIRLALSDISFTDELDAATLYSCILDDNSEQTMAALLLKQKSKDIGVSETNVSNYAEKKESAIISIFCIALLLIIVFAVLYYKLSKFRKGVKHVANVIVYIIIASILVDAVSTGVFHSYNFGWVEFISVLVICISSYIAVMSKICNQLFKTTVHLAVLSFIVLVFITFVRLIEYNSLSPAIIISVIAALVLILSICIKFKKIKIKWKDTLKFIGIILFKLLKKREN